MKKTLLYEISIIRPLIIFLLVAYHALCVFTGGWNPPDGVSSNTFYWWLGHLICGFRIETIAFVGGYVFFFQCSELGKRIGPLPFVWKKFKRLIIPCFIFGTIYFLLYRFNPARFNWNVAFWRVANGIGHLWFLPMLFWCFLASWLIDQLLALLQKRLPKAFKPAGWLLLAALAVLSLARITGLKMGLSRAPYFIYYFYLGYWLRACTTFRQPSQRHGSVAIPIALWAIYLASLLIHLQATHLQLPGAGWLCPHWLRGCSKLALHLMAFVHTTCGILALYSTVTLWLKRHRTCDAQPSPFLRQCSALCYGVYVLHMFFMQPIYYHTPFPAWCCASPLGLWLMPWMVLAATLALSIAATWLLLKTRFGRFLIG